MSNKRIGERIKHAESESEIQALLDEGATFKDVADKTVRRWRKLAVNRGNQLRRKLKEAA